MTLCPPSTAPVLVAGPSAEATALVLELRAAGVDCWGDRMDRVAADFVSLDWAGALVVIDPSKETQVRHRRSLLEFRGPSMLILPGQVQGSALCDFVSAGFDQVVSMSCDPDEVVARVRRLLGQPSAPRYSYVDLAG
jgi:hypothetical protein